MSGQFGTHGNTKPAVVVLHVLFPWLYFYAKNQRQWFFPSVNIDEQRTK